MANSCRKCGASRELTIDAAVRSTAPAGTS